MKDDWRELWNSWSCHWYKSTTPKHPTDLADTDRLVSSDNILGFFDFLGLSSFPERAEVDALDPRERSGWALEDGELETMVVLLPGGFGRLAVDQRCRGLQI